MIAVQGAMPDICKKCKERGGLEDGLYLIHTEEDYVNFYCDGQSPKTCPIKGEIPDKHGRLGDLDKLYEVATAPYGNLYGFQAFIKDIKNAPTVLEATE